MLQHPGSSGTTHRRIAIRRALTSMVCLAMAGLHIGANAQERVEVGSPDELLSFFEEIDYTPEAWQAGIREIPRVYLMRVGSNWRVNSQNIEVIHKKHIFFRTLGPLVLSANELILTDRERLVEFDKAGPSNEEEAVWVRDLALSYEVIDQPNAELEASDLEELIKRVDAVPPSLVLAQGAEESGWGTSRFAAEGNALFGQWTWGGKGIKPKDQREELGDYRIAAYDSPLESVQAYLLNINTHPGYADLRARRADMRARGEVFLSGWDLAETLTSYSERGTGYVESLHTIMRVNHLQSTDEAVLAGDDEFHIYPTPKAE